KALTINGPNMGTPGTGVRGAEAILLNCAIDINNAGNTTLDGLHILRTDSTTIDQIILDGAGTNTVQNCIFERNDGMSVVPGEFVRAITTSAGGGVKNILNNKFTGNGSNLFSAHRTWNNAMFINGGTATVNITGNTIMNSRTGLSIDDYTVNVNTSGNTFDNNGTHIGLGGTIPVAGSFVLGSNEFKAAGSAIVNLSNVTTAFRLDMTSSTWLGTPFSALPNTTLFAIEAGMFHRGRSGRNGLVTYVPNNQYVIPVNNSIQLAVNYAPVSGHIINVAPGATYPANISINGKSLIIQGQGCDDVTGTTIDGLGSALNGISVLTNTTGVTIRNLKIKNTVGGSDDAGIRVHPGCNGLLIEDVCLVNTSGRGAIYVDGPVNGVNIEDCEVSGTGVNGRGITVWNGFKENITITGNNVHDIGGCCGIELQDGNASGVTMDGNTVTNVGDSGMSAIGLNGSTGLNSISGNTITNTGRFGIEVKNPAGSVTVSNNDVSLTIVNSDRRDRAGIAVFRRGVLNNNVDVPNGVTVSSNAVQGFEQNALYDEGFGIVIEGTNHTVTDNTINNCNVGIQQQGGAHPNANYPAGDGDQGTSGQASTASLNYFGRGNSPFACGNLIDNTNSFSGNGTNTRNVISANNLGLVTNTSNGETFCNIQAAIDDAQTANGHILTVAAGTYAETINLNKSVTLRGPNHSLAPCVDTRVAEAIITGGLNVTAGITMTVVIEGFHFQGVSSPFNYNGNIGTTTLTATFRNNLVNSSSGQMAAFVGATDNANLTISNNCFQNMASNAMQLGGGNFVTQ
ncbi:MAG TPA: right-handed parallel beta-helix repeat-containing protein, partial [Bacteroidia bacterium]|nr:right-handed parallel beta-helix repeat-containing protein [Bacteroidia bacterium]